MDKFLVEFFNPPAKANENHQAQPLSRDTPTVTQAGQALEQWARPGQALV